MADPLSAVELLALAALARLGPDAYGVSIQEEIKKSANESVPLHLRNPVTPLMKEQGYGKGYKYAHDYPGHFVEQQNLPDSLQEKRYRPSIKNVCPFVFGVKSHSSAKANSSSGPRTF